MSEKDNLYGQNKSPKKNKQEFSKKIGDYVLLGEIGTGTFSKVAKAFHIITDQEVAVKILQKDKIKDNIDIERILREIEILKKVIHPNICQLYETYSTVHNFYLMIEHITGGDLFDYITDNNYLSETLSCKFFRQLISVIEYLNELGISHRDIKPENILLDENHQNIKLIDFGLSNYFSEKKLLKSSCGSPCYASPEMLSGKPYLGITTDLWSAGVVLYSMLVGSLPFDDQELYELYKQIKLGKFYLPSTLSLEAIDLLKRILNVDPKKRIGLEGIKEHKWFQMDGYPLYMGINLNKEKLGYNIEVIDYVMKNYFGKENDFESISKDEYIDMIKEYYCNKYTSTYYLTKKYILKINDIDSIFKKNEQKEEKNLNEKTEKNMNIKYDKKICKKNPKDNTNILKNNIENNDKKNNNYIIKNNINLEIKSEEKKKEDYNYNKNNNEKIPNVEDNIENKELILTVIDEPSNKKTNSKKIEFPKNAEKIKLFFNKKGTENKNEENTNKRNFKKNELFLNNIKNTNLKTHYRNSIEIKQKKFTKNLLLKGSSKTKDNYININNTNNNNINSSYVKTWGNNSINHISKNKKITFIHSGNNKLNNINYNYLCYNYNISNNNTSNNNSHYFTKNKHENSSSINSYKKNKNQKQNSKKIKDKTLKNYNSNNTSYNNKKLNSNSNNKYSLSSSKQKENNFNFYLINNYINQNESKSLKNNLNLNSYNFGKISNSTKNEDSPDSNINFSQYYLVKTRKYNMLKTIDLPGTYSSRYNTEINNKKIQDLNGSLKPYNKIKVNLKTESNKLSEANSPKFNKNKTNSILNNKNSLEKNINMSNNYSYTNKSSRKKNSILKASDIKVNNNIKEDKKLINSFSVKKDNLISSISKNININQNTKNSYKNNSKIQYQLYYLNETKPNSNNKLSSNIYENILNTNLKNICLKPKGIWLKNYTKKITRRNSSNSTKFKNNIILKGNTSNNFNNNSLNKNNVQFNRNDIYNKKKITNNSTQKNNVKNYIFKELFSIEEDDKISDIKCHFNTKRIKNKILLLNELYLSNKCSSPKEFYSFNDSGLSSYHSDANIYDNQKNFSEKIKQNFSNMYNRKKNLIIKTEQNSSTEKTNSPQSTDKKIKYIYKSKLSLY